MGRVEEQTEVKRRGRDNIRKPPNQYYDQVYLDFVSPSKLALDFAYQFAGPDRLLFGSDHPWVSIETIEDIVLPYWLLNSEELEELFLDSGDNNNYNHINNRPSSLG